MTLSIPLPVGDVFDRLSILNLKYKKLKNILNSIQKEGLISETLLINKTIENHGLEWVKENNHFLRLIKVNEVLWDVTEYRRKNNKDSSYTGKDIYYSKLEIELNDERFSCKQSINYISNSNLKEIKSFKLIK